jgi:hypothetical protein
MDDDKDREYSTPQGEDGEVEITQTDHINAKLLNRFKQAIKDDPDKFFVDKATPKDDAPDSDWDE